MMNPIQGFSPGRQPQTGSTIGRMMNAFGSSIRELFRTAETPLEAYTLSLRNLINSTFYIGEWLRIILDQKREKERARGGMRDLPS